MATFTALHIDDSVTTCECCGRVNLKATVLMQSDLGDLVHFGRTCAARNSGKDQRQIKEEVIQHTNDNIGRASNELRFSDEARAMRSYRLTAPWAEIGWDAYGLSGPVASFNILKSRLAAKYNVPLSSF